MFKRFFEKVLSTRSSTPKHVRHREENNLETIYNHEETTILDNESAIGKLMKEAEIAIVIRQMTLKYYFQNSITFCDNSSTHRILYHVFDDLFDPTVKIMQITIVTASQRNIQYIKNVFASSKFSKAWKEDLIIVMTAEDKYFRVDANGNVETNFESQQDQSPCESQIHL